jgi:hypothetical protein
MVENIYMQFIYDDALFSLSNNTVGWSGSRERVLQTNHKATNHSIVSMFNSEIVASLINWLDLYWK